MCECKNSKIVDRIPSQPSTDSADSRGDGTSQNDDLPKLSAASADETTEAKAKMHAISLTNMLHLCNPYFQTNRNAYVPRSDLTCDGYTEFISHVWRTKWFYKWLSLCARYNLIMASVVSNIVVIVIVILQNLAALGYVQMPIIPQKQRSIERWVMKQINQDPVLGASSKGIGILVPIGTLVFLFVLFFGHRFGCRRRLRQKRLFLDKASIAQCPEYHPIIDPRCSHCEEKMQGIRNIGHFLEQSDSLIILWDKYYFHRLWTVFEIGIYIGEKGSSNVKFLPIYLIATVILMFFLTSIIMFFTSVTALVETGMTSMKASITVHLVALAFLSVVFSAFFSLFRHQIALQQNMMSELAEFSLDKAECFHEEDRHFIKEHLMGFRCPEKVPSKGKPLGEVASKIGALKHKLAFSFDFLRGTRVRLPSMPTTSCCPPLALADDTTKGKPTDEPSNVVVWPTASTRRYSECTTRPPESSSSDVDQSTERTRISHAASESSAHTISTLHDNVARTHSRPSACSSACVVNALSRETDKAQNIGYSTSSLPISSGGTDRRSPRLRRRRENSTISWEINEMVEPAFRASSTKSTNVYLTESEEDEPVLLLDGIRRFEHYVHTELATTLNKKIGVYGENVVLPLSNVIIMSFSLSWAVLDYNVSTVAPWRIVYDSCYALSFALIFGPLLGFMFVKNAAFSLRRMPQRKYRASEKAREVQRKVAKAAGAKTLEQRSPDLRRPRFPNCMSGVMFAESLILIPGGMLNLFVGLALYMLWIWMYAYCIDRWYLLLIIYSVLLTFVLYVYSPDRQEAALQRQMAFKAKAHAAKAALVNKVQKLYSEASEGISLSMSTRCRPSSTSSSTCRDDLSSAPKLSVMSNLSDLSEECKDSRTLNVAMETER